jgi:3-hydroxyisobutyrate dehydrogenase
MGVPMAANLERAGFAVQSFDLEGTGNQPSIRQAAQHADAFITMLPDGEAVREAVLEALPALSAGAVVIDMSSSDPASTRALEAVLSAQDVLLIDAPVSGALAKAKAGTLAIMVGGDAGVVEKSMPVLRALGNEIFHVGPLGAGHAVMALTTISAPQARSPDSKRCSSRRPSAWTPGKCSRRSTPRPVATAPRSARSRSRC